MNQTQQNIKMSIPTSIWNIFMYERVFQENKNDKFNITHLQKFI